MGLNNIFTFLKWRLSFSFPEPAKPYHYPKQQDDRKNPPTHMHSPERVTSIVVKHAFIF